MSITFDQPDITADLAFTLDQLATLLTWSAGGPFGLDISLAFDHQGFLEVAEVIRCDPREVLYSLKPGDAGTVILAGAYAGRCDFDSVEAALGRVLELDGDADRPVWGCFAGCGRGEIHVDSQRPEGPDSPTRS